MHSNLRNTEYNDSQIEPLLKKKNIRDFEGSYDNPLKRFYQSGSKVEEFSRTRSISPSKASA